MRTFNVLTVVMVLGLAGCGKAASTLFADHSIPLVAPAASAEAVPVFVGRWRTVPGQCGDPLMIQARRLDSGAVHCDFDKVEATSAGFVVDTVCREQGHLQPGRMSVVLPNPGHATSLTLSGGPFRDAVALERCPARL